ncbi:hypothetical protein IE4872_PD01126 (plasmid) [Rhizobium gallicum]|uniref:Uncharacterized protein n=1 Tax=Rhizobium gallicum TaxID=56730 RepID=A0A1L5NUR7_9HYPH|nr:hypothetical protein IE4872_PD01126 [Rhizobium gallicum]
MAVGDICGLFAVRANPQNGARIVVFKAQRAMLMRFSRTPAITAISSSSSAWAFEEDELSRNNITSCNRSVTLQEGMALLWLQNPVMLA